MAGTLGPLFGEQTPDDGPLSLYPSLSVVLGVLLAIGLFFVTFGLVNGWWVISISLGFVLLVVLLGGDRRVDLDGESITFLPLVPLRPRQHFLFRDLGPFHRYTASAGRGRQMESVRASIESGPPARLFGVWPKYEIAIGSGYGRSYRSAGLPLDDLIRLLETRRRAARERGVWR